MNTQAEKIRTTWYCLSTGLLFRKSSSCLVPQQNVLSERDGHTLTDVVLSFLKNYGLPRFHAGRTSLRGLILGQQVPQFGLDSQKRCVEIHGK